MHDLTAHDIRSFVGQRAPDVVFSSPPCKSFSALLSDKIASQEKYQKLSRLVIRWVELMIHTWSDEPPRLIIMENVPRITSRGRRFLEEVHAILENAGYCIHEGFHDCGEIGGLAQHRRRFLMVARLPRRCPPFLYKPQRLRVRGCGEVLEKLPVPGTLEAAHFGKLHHLPGISWINWVRLALIPAGGDWRDLPRVLESQLGSMVDNPNRYTNKYRVEDWSAPAKTVIGATRPGSGAACVADPRTAEWHSGVLGVREWNKPAGAVTSRSGPSNGEFSVADPRLTCSPWGGAYGVSGWEDPAPTVTGGRLDNSGVSVADIRVKQAFDHGYKVLRWTDPSFTVAGQTSCGYGAFQVADPRVDQAVGRRIVFEQLLSVWDGDPKKAPPFIPVIVCPDNCWHRPMTPMELAILQGLPTELDGRPLGLSGNSVSRWRERIGNAVPVQTAEAVATKMLIALLETELYGADPVRRGEERWVEELFGGSNGRRGTCGA